MSPNQKSVGILWYNPLIDGTYERATRNTEPGVYKVQTGSKPVTSIEGGEKVAGYIYPTPQEWGNQIEQCYHGRDGKRLFRGMSV